MFIGVILNLVGGMLDSHTYLFRNGVFANTQTGNIVFLALNLVGHNKHKILQCLESMLAFIFGVFLTEFLKQIFKNKKPKFVSLVLLLELSLLAVLTLIPKNMFDDLVIVLVSFVCAMQTNSFRSLKGSIYASTMCTGNLRSFATHFFNFIFLKNSKSSLVCLQFFVVLLSFFLGVIIGGWLTNKFFQFTYFFCCVLLFVNLLFINLNKKL